MQVPPPQDSPGASGTMAGRIARLRAMLDAPGVVQTAGVLGRPFASILLLPGAWLGLPLWLVVAHDPRAALLALVGLGLGEAMRRLMAIEPSSAPGGSIRANAVLTALAVAWLVPAGALPAGVTLALVAVATVLAALLAAALARALAGTGLPPLVLGYCAAAGLMFVLFPGLAQQATLATDWGPAPDGAAGWAGAFLRSLGAFLFTPAESAGAVIALVILLGSPTLFVTGAAGWAAGVLTALLLARSGVTFYWLPTAYNFFIAGMALGAVYFVPGWRALAVACVGGVVTALIAAGLQNFLYFSAVSFLPVAFSASVWIGLGALSRAAGRGIVVANRHTGLPPAEARRRTRLEHARWGRGEPLLMVPMTDEVEVTQGFGGRISHRGAWRHALDFQRPEGGAGSDAVLAPAPGYVERVASAIPDNPKGETNYAENWGNHVVIRLDAGGWCMLAHLAQGSVAVAPGARVETGTYVGRMGSSGRSPVPHLHLQVQDGPEPGTPTRPFRLANFVEAERAGEPLAHWRAAAVPAEGSVICAALATPETHRLLAGLATGRGLWSVEAKGSLPAAFRPARGMANLRIEAALDAAGRLVLSDRGGGRLAVRFDIDAWRIESVGGAASPLLRLLGLAVPAVPYAARAGLAWREPAVPAPHRRHAPLTELSEVYGTGAPRLARCECLAHPGGEGSSLVVETRPAPGTAALPRRIRVEFAPLAGPSRVEAEFDGGALGFTLYSFAQEQPLADEAG